MSWFELKIVVATGFREAVTNFVWENGAEGVTEMEELGQVLSYFPEEKMSAVTAALNVYAAELAQIFPGQKTFSFTSEKMQRTDWADAWKKYCFPQPLGRTFYLQPTWSDQPIPPGRTPILMDPGMAFGTGLHASTQMCVQLLEEELEKTSARSIRFLDLGTGSGILAIVAYKLGIRRIWAADVDADALTVAKENFERNGCEGIELVHGSLDVCPGPFDLLVANILLATHVDLMASYRTAVKRRGTLILSGLLGVQKEAIKESLDRAEFQPSRLYESGEWMACSVRAQGGAA